MSFLSLAFAFVLVLAPFRASLASVTFEQAFDAALARNESPAIQSEISAQAAERVNQTQGAIFPNVSLVAGYTRQDSPTRANTTAFTDPNQSSARIALTQPLFRGLREFRALGAAKATLRAQQLGEESVRLALYGSVGQAFYNVLTAERDLMHLRELLDLSQKRVTELVSRTRIGRSRRGELLTAEAQVASVRAQIEAADAQLEQARASFALITGLAVREPLEDKLTVPARAPSLEQAISQAQSRPDLRAQQELVSVAEEQVSFARGGHYPTLDLLGNYYLHRTGPQADNKWDLGVALVLPIFQGGAVTSATREAAHRERQAELSAAQARRTAERDVRLAHAAFDSALRQIEFLARATDAAEKNYREQVRDYQLGLVSNLETIQALNALTDSRRAQSRAYFVAKAAWLGLQAAVGEAPARAYSGS